MYSYAPNDLKRFAYDILAARYKPAIEAKTLDLGDPFEVLFPEPPGMDAHRRRMEAREAERSRTDLDSINRQ